MNKQNEVNERIIKRQDESIEILKSLLKTKELIIHELKEQLRIGGVSQQRELLITVFEKMNRPHITMLEVGEYEKLADELLSN